jgi:short subunit dehydrogenase-like uncharacterized protein
MLMTFQPSAPSPDPTSSEKPDRTVAVFGAAGHTGRFVVSELRRRGLTPILSGQDGAKLKDVGDAHPGTDVSRQPGLSLPARSLARKIF